MRSQIRLSAAVLALLFAFDATPGSADTFDDLLRRYAAQARQENAAFKSFSESRGRDFYARKSVGKSGEMSCATCHTADPRTPGRTKAGKVIEPLAPSVTPQRFTDDAKVEKWFRRNCSDVLGRPCTALEKGDFMTFVGGLR